MKRKFISVLAAGFSVAAHCAQVQFEANVLKTAPERAGTSIGGVPSYELAPYDFDAGAATRRARELLSKSPAAAKARNLTLQTSDEKERIKFTAGPVEYEVAKATGGEYLLDLDRYAIAQPGAAATDPKAVRATADAYIRSHLPALDRKELRFTGIKRIMDATSELANDGTVKSRGAPRVANFIAIYERRLSGLPVFGSGENVRVYIGADGSVVGHSMVWRKVVGRDDLRPVLSTGEIQKRFAERHRANSADQVTVDRLYFGYLAQGRYTEQTRLSPVFHIGYVYGPHSKRVFETYDAYSGRLIEFPKHDEAGDKKTGT
jgi:hypothetical protein